MATVDVHDGPSSSQAELAQQLVQHVDAVRAVIRHLASLRVVTGVWPGAPFDEIYVVSKSLKSNEPLEHPGHIAADREAYGVRTDNDSRHVSSQRQQCATLAGDRLL